MFVKTLKKYFIRVSFTESLSVSFSDRMPPQKI